MAKDKVFFFENVYKLVRMVPYGRVTTYGDIAKYLGASPRMVGWAMNSSHTALPPVPAHRVVNRNGLLTGKMFFETPTLMQQLLENEGLIIINDQIQDFEKLRWNSFEETLSK
ncbi:MAG: MGMT family protein [Chitinophagales bacterium]|nr:MGMT family protein [Chitinophagales bacterium]